MKEKGVVAKSAVYARQLSSGDLVGEAQITVCLRAATRYGWVIDQAHFFQDAGADARKQPDKRPGLVAMLTAAESRAFGVLIVNNLRCISRKVAEILSIYRTLSRLGVKIHVASSSSDVAGGPCSAELMIQEIPNPSEMVQMDAQPALKDGWPSHDS